MLGIRIRGIDLDISEDSKLSVEWVSTIINESADLLGSFSYPFLLPFTAKNKAALSNAQQPENRLARQAETVLLTVFGRSWKTANMVYEVTPVGFDADLQIDNGEFASLISETELPSMFTIYKDGMFRDHQWITIEGTTAEEIEATMDDSCQKVGKYPWVFFPIRNEKKFGAVTTDGTEEFLEWDFINPWDNGFIHSTIDIPTQKRTYYSPALYLKWVVQQLCLNLGFEPAGKFFQDEFIDSLVIVNTGCYDMDTVFSSGGFKFAPARHLPKIKINEFIKALRQDFRLAIYFDAGERKAWFEFSEELLESDQQVSIAEFADLKSLVIKPNDKQLFKLNVKIDANDELYKSMPYTANYYIGSGKKATSVDMGTGTTYMRLFTNPYGEHLWRTPWMMQLANIYSDKANGSEAYNDPDNKAQYSKNEFTFRLLSYKGLVRDANQVLYPYATADGKDENEAEAFPISLNPGGDNGLLATYNTSWYRFLLETEQHQLNTFLPEAKLNQMSPLIKLQYVTESQAVITGLMDKVNFEADEKQGVLSAKISLYPYFNIAGLRPATVNEFQEGNASAADLLFVKLSIRNIRENAEYKHRHGERTGDLWINFYLDEAATIPKTVTNQKIRITRKFEGLKVHLYRSEYFDFTVSGADVAPFYYNVRLHYHKVKRLGQDELENFFFGMDSSSAAKLGYTIIPPTEGTDYAKMY